MTNLSLLAKQLRPYWLRDTGAGGATIIHNHYHEHGGGGGGGGMVVHGLDSQWHDGTLPWASLAGYPTFTAGDGLTGGGTLAANRSFAVNLDSSGALETNSGALRVKLHATVPGLVRDSNGLRLGAPGTLDHASSNAVSGAGHTHAVTASADVSAGTESLLKSNNAGWLGLKALSVKGNVDITDGGDLYVAGSGAYAGNPVLFADSNGGNVGIMGFPDPQFALDVWGPLRAQYFIGPHAIMLKNVLLLAKFEGRQPFETNFYGEPNGHMGQVAQVSGGITFREGMFGSKAVQIADATTNLVPNPSFEVNVTDGWTYFQSGTGGSVARTASNAHVGTYSARIAPSSVGSSGIYTGDILVGLGQTVHAQCRVYRNSGGSALVELYNNSDGVVAASATSVLSNEWELVTLSYTLPGGAKNMRLRIWNTAGGTAQSILVDACQVEIGSEATPYCDGTLGVGTFVSGHNWSGTAHNSTSTRVAANFQYPTTGNINPVRGTIMGWVYRANQTSTNTLLRVDGTTAGVIILRATGSAATAFWGTGSGISGGTVPVGVWTHLAMSLNGTTLRLYVNGAEVASGTSSGFDGLPATMGVGRSVSGGNLLNGLIDDLVITSVPLSGEQILSVYESDAPVFAEQSRFSFRATPRNLIWADDDGLWMRDHTGSPMMGMYGGETVDYTWGGMLLNTGDVLIGNSTSYMMWDASLSRVTVKGAIEVIGTIPNTSISGLGTLSTQNNLDGVPNGSTYARVNSTLITGGNIRVGSGTKDSNLNGWHIDSTEIVGQTSGADQVVMGTDGKIKAGAGNVLLESAGITIEEASSTSGWLKLRVGGQQTAMLHTFKEAGAGWVSGGNVSWPGYRLSLVNLSSAPLGGFGSYVYRDGITPGPYTYGEVRNVAIGNWFTVVPQSGLVDYSPRLSMTAGSGSAQIITDQAQLALEAAGSGTVRARSDLEARRVLILGGTGDNIGRMKPAGSHTVANDATLSLGTGTGWVFIQNSTDGYGAVFYLRATNSMEMFDSHGMFSPTSGTANSANVYHDGSVWRLENKRGASKGFHIIWMGLSTNF